MGPNFPFDLCFASGRVQIRQNGAVVFTGTGLPWTAANVKQIVFKRSSRLQIVICFPGMQPQVISWTENSTTFAIAPYEVQVIGNSKRTPFYRISPQGITLMLPSAARLCRRYGHPGHVGPGVRCGNGRHIHPVHRPADPDHRGDRLDARHRHAPGDPVRERGALLFGNQATPLDQLVAVGDVVIGQISGAKGQVTSVSSSTKTILVQLLSLEWFSAVGAADAVVGPGGEAAAPRRRSGIGPSGRGDDLGRGGDERLFRGWPQCRASPTRTGSAASPTSPRVPPGVSWSAINNPIDLYVPTEEQFITADNAIFELAPGKSQVLHIVAGAESDEFVFCDNAIYWIPINIQNPLSATGAVVFNKIDEGAANVQPRFFRGSIVYINAAANMVRLDRGDRRL